MKDSATEVRVSLMQNISKLANKIGEEEVENLILPEVSNLSKDNTWRVRLATIDFIPMIPEFLSERLFSEQIEPLLLNFLEDSVHSVRVEASNCLIKLKNNSYGLQWLERIIDKKLEELHKHSRFNFRIHTLFMINHLHKEVSD